MMQINCAAIAAFGFVLSATEPSHAAVVFVNANLSSGANTGTSWTNAHQGRLGLQAALAAANSGDDLWVAQGVYAPAPTNGDINASFILESGVRLLGGFVGNESSQAQRDPAIHVTTLTGDLNANDPSGAFGALNDNAAHVVRATGPAGSGTLDGFSILAGRAEMRLGGVTPDVVSGGGLLCQNASPLITACRMIDNHADAEGGGIAVFGGGVVVEDCFFTRNRARVGAGIGSRSGASTSVRRCRFIESGVSNNSISGVGIGAGKPLLGTDPSPGAIEVADCEFSIQCGPNTAQDGVGVKVGGGHATILRCRFVRCTSIAKGGGVSVSNATLVADRCLFVGNEARFDGGAAVYSFEHGDLTLTNCVLAGNDRTGFSTVHVQNGARLSMVNCTLFDNGTSGTFHFPMLVGDDAVATLHNCIVHANKSSVPSTLPLGVTFGTAVMTVASSCIEGWNGQFPSVATFAGNPLFVNAAGLDGITGTQDDDLRLLVASPCIDRGNNALVPAGVLLDIAGSPRFRDVTGVPDLGVGPAPVVDIGAHERVPPCPTDLNGDGAVNTVDLTAFLGAFGQGTAPFASADLDGDGAVTTSDLTVFLGAFGAPCT